jgi:hypothetical protein
MLTDMKKMEKRQELAQQMAKQAEALACASVAFAVISPPPVRMAKTSLRPSGTPLMATLLSLPQKRTKSRLLRHEEEAG